MALRDPVNNVNMVRVIMAAKNSKYVEAGRKGGKAKALAAATRG